MGWNAGAVSTKGIASGDGYVEFTAPGTGRVLMAGLGHGDTDLSYQDIDYAMYLYNGDVYVYESGAYTGWPHELCDAGTVSRWPWKGRR